MANSRGYYLRFPCPECGATQKVLAAQVGTEIRCAECPAVIIVPHLEQLKAADKLHNEKPKLAQTPKKPAPTPRRADAKAPPAPLELNVVHGQVLSFACPVCHTKMRAAAEELGHVIMCPQCFSPVTVGGESHKKAPAVPEPPSLVLEDTGDDEYQLAQEPPPKPVSPPRPLQKPKTKGDSKPARDSNRASGSKPARQPEPTSNHGRQDHEDDEYRLSDAEERPQFSAPRLMPDDLTLGDESSRRPRPTSPGDGARPPRRDRAAPVERRVSLEEGLEGFDADIQERHDRPTLEDRLAAAQKERVPAEPPDHPFVSGVFGFLLYPSSWKRWLGLAVGAAIVYFLTTNAVVTGLEGGSSLFLSLIFAAMAAASGLLLIPVAAVAALSIVQDTGAGADEVENWPDFNFIDWVGQSLFVINAIAFSALPGFLIASGLESWGPLRWALPGLTGVLLFPVILLSQLDGNSPFSLLTPNVLKSIAAAPGAWLAFYLVFLMVTAAATGLGWVTLQAVRWESFPAALMLGTVGSAALMLASRLIGRLAWFCEEEEVMPEPKPDADELEPVDREIIQ